MLGWSILQDSQSLTYLHEVAVDLDSFLAVLDGIGVLLKRVVHIGAYKLPA